MLSHIDKKGNAKIVDISKKSTSDRFAIAYGTISVSDNVIKQIRLNNNKKGDILTVAKLAGIMAAKSTYQIIPLCHPLIIDDIGIEFVVDESKKIVSSTASVKCHGKTGVEMEALTAVSISLLTIYDMCKAIDKTMKIKNITLLKKYGGKSLL
jgi:cyclic pyranopterin phosphate synthase